MISVSAGEAAYERIAQRQALALAKLFRANLRLIIPWDAEEVRRLRESGVFRPDGRSASSSLREFLDEAEAADLQVAPSFRGDDLDGGLLGESRVSDLIVLGMPDEAAAERNPRGDEAFSRGISLIQRAECPLLIVSSEPKSIGRLLVSYRVGKEGKAALRLAGCLGERCRASVTVLAEEDELSQAVMATMAAEDYLSAYDLKRTEAVDRLTNGRNGRMVLDVARSVGADAIIVGPEPYGILEELYGRPEAGGLSREARIPLFIAR